MTDPRLGNLTDNLERQVSFRSEECRHDQSETMSCDAYDVPDLGTVSTPQATSSTEATQAVDKSFVLDQDAFSHT